VCLLLQVWDGGHAARAVDIVAGSDLDSYKQTRVGDRAHFPTVNILTSQDEHVILTRTIDRRL
jgi:hypothetical protein